MSIAKTHTIIADEQTTAETIAEQARDYYHDTIYSAITAEDVEQADAYTNDHLSLTVEVMDALGIFHASSRMLVAIAQAMRWTLDDIETQAIEEAHDRAAAALIDAYAEAIGEHPTEDDPETRAAYRVARDEVTGTSDRATETAKQAAAEADSLKDVEAYAHDAKTNANAAAWALDRMTKDHRETAAELARFARTCADLAKDAADNAAASYEHARRTYYADYQTSTYAAQALAIRAEQRDDAQKEAQRAEETAQKVEALAAAEANRPSPEDDAPAARIEAGAPYHREDLEAFLGAPEDYDVRRIEAAATAIRTHDGVRVWAVGPDLVWSVAERFELTAYAPAM